MIDEFVKEKKTLEDQLSHYTRENDSLKRHIETNRDHVDSDDHATLKETLQALQILTDKV